MFGKIKSYLRKHKENLAFLVKIKKRLNQYNLKKSTKKRIDFLCKNDNPKIFYIGIPVHANLGDLAQGVCIRKWLKKHYSEYDVLEIETNALVNTPFSLLKKLKKVFNVEKDFIVFQSGYTTTDLGGYADIVHQAVMNAMPKAKVLMMPQTIFFESKERKELCSKVYNSQKDMLFLARDNISFEMAKEMFPNIKVMCFPDIVTTLIGSVESNVNRSGICFCLRNDSEKFYTDEELQVLIDNCSKIADVSRLDTTKVNTLDVVNNAERYVYAEVECYSKYKVMITDRYHGTILSLVAGTPVIVIKTNDHKVTTGVDWFKDVYSDHVFLASNLEEAYELAKEIYGRLEYPTLQPYFEREYYDRLPNIFNSFIKRGI